mmetsp:Transcript_20175/g.41886  ORF Transcript_20175/g.41886 Transcript_20175/m.41886 type:complete len:705 (-) Transcript_20175:198-2312(-)|eukprot:CAMPEP_0201119568 /NCGR_PEP_ID=MMETSP0850-20130426/3677_1 /ASSEMBLY_ACC=CAM_ASM_000622 /TAXON_ID=183588 /ORGANISM="Pseudo-nitzschia fraudulenta, Strain WWA7" /LENGTH=704 /DNA_ID=CAMNT_0047385311 /DNA_START=44 /DNA_END=2158 /DNA_ORIENTATION=-
MEDPVQHQRRDDSGDDASESQRLAEEAMEQMLLAQEDEELAGYDEFDERDRVVDVDDISQDGALGGFGDIDNGNNNDNMLDDMALLDDDDLVNHNNNEIENDNHNIDFQESPEKKNPFTYVRVSFLAAVFLVYYAFRSRQQWYLALVFLSSSKYAYVIMGNAFVAALFWSFTAITGFFLNGMRLNETEGLGDYFRWHITETCLALTIFRSELTVKVFVVFLLLVFSKCLHHIVDTREAHLRMTEEIVVANPTNGWFSLRMSHVKLFGLIALLQVADVVAVVLCGQDIMTNGPSVSILFGFESAIMLTSVISNNLLWYLHLLDGIFHFLHETSNVGSIVQRWIYPWKDHKATLVFAVELQAQAAKFVFYLTFFSIVMTYYGMPINLIREVYVSFLALKQRMIAFHKYRQLMGSMNRFQNPTEEELAEEHTCIICRDEMTVETAKRLPGCGHIFHKSCLREWLVQQQTCPTCRGDISAMEAKQKAKDAADARIREQQQLQEQEKEETKNAGTTESENTEATTNQQPTQEDKLSAEDTDESGTREPPALLARVEDESMELKTRTRTTNGRIRSNRNSPIKRFVPAIDPDTGLIPAFSSSRCGVSGFRERPAFPAFYRVANQTGAPVYRDDNVTESPVLRVVSFGVVFLGIEMGYRKCNGENRMMIRMPDGWVVENKSIERIIAVPFEQSTAPPRTTPLPVPSPSQQQ